MFGLALVRKAACCRNFTQSAKKQL